MARILNPKPNGMTPHSLFNVLIKVIGLFFLKGLLEFLPELVYWLASLKDLGHYETRVMGIYLLSGVLIKLLVVSVLLFKTEWVIDKLKLASNFSEDTLVINFHRSIIISIFIIIFGLWILLNNLPELLWTLWVFLKSKPLDPFNSLNLHRADYRIFTKALVVVIGILMIRYNTKLTNWIELRRRNG